MTPAGTSNELDVQNGWEENTTHTRAMIYCSSAFLKAYHLGKNTQQSVSYSNYVLHLCPGPSLPPPYNRILWCDAISKGILLRLRRKARRRNGRGIGELYRSMVMSVLRRAPTGWAAGITEIIFLRARAKRTVFSVVLLGPSLGNVAQEHVVVKVSE